MMLEALVHPASSFVTLTYNRENIPDAGSLDPRDLQLWLKRYRKVVGPIRFFGVGEYGDHTERPHYHVAVFGRGREDTEIVRRTWGQGHVLCGDLTLSSAAYIAGYVTKKMTAKDDARLGGRYPEFARMSLRPGIGFPAISRIAAALQNKYGWDEIERTGDVPKVLTHERRSLPLGRYMREGLRSALGHEFVAEPRGVAIEKSAKMFSLYQDYVDTSGSTSMEGFRLFEAERKKQKVKQMEKRSKIHNGGSL